MSGTQDALLSAGNLPNVSTVMPQGRLTLQSGTPIMRADQTAQATVYYSAFVGNGVPVWDGFSNIVRAIPNGEIPLALTSGNHLTATVYDVFAIYTPSLGLVIGTGPAWASTTSRGTGAGTTQIDLATRGYWTNTVALASLKNGSTDYGTVAAGSATYLGSFYTTAAGQTGVALRPAAASGGSANVVGLYNAYNRVRAIASCMTTTTSWTWASLTPIQFDAANGGGVSFRVTYLDALGQTPINATITGQWTGSDSVAGINLDSTSTIPRGGINCNTNGASTATDMWLSQFGVHFYTPVIYNLSILTTRTTYNLGPAGTQLQVSLEI